MNGGDRFAEGTVLDIRNILKNMGQIMLSEVLSLEGSSHSETYKRLS